MPKKEKMHKVRDVAAPRHDREVSGAGVYGLAFGGLSGDGDVKMFKTVETARDTAAGHFAEFLLPSHPYGTLVSTRYLTVDEALKLTEDYTDQLSSWTGTVDGECLDIVVDATIVKLRIGVFRCWWGDYTDEKGRRMGNKFTIPMQVRLPGGMNRVVKTDD